MLETTAEEENPLLSPISLDFTRVQWYQRFSLVETTCTIRKNVGKEFPDYVLLTFFVVWDLWYLREMTPPLPQGTFDAF